jgi:hypothetical protein
MTIYQISGEIQKSHNVTQGVIKKGLQAAEVPAP